MDLTLDTIEKRKAWQRFVGVCADGDLGPNTKKATKVFQKKHSLVADGIAGPSTLIIAAHFGFSFDAPAEVLTDRTFTDYKDLVALAEAEGFHVTSTTGGKHNRGSKHFKGLAIDVRTRDKTDDEIERFLRICRSRGLKAIDERTHPDGQVVWGGPHLHIEITRKVLRYSTEPKSEAAASVSNSATKSATELVPNLVE